MKTKQELKQLGLAIAIQLALFIPILGVIYLYDTATQEPTGNDRHLYRDGS